VTVELVELSGRLTDEHVGWIMSVYGPVDAKYRSTEYVRHQFVDNPFGSSVNVFAIADGRPVGHCGVVPFHARRGDESFAAGKLEALAVDAAFRGRSLATDILSRLYPLAVENGLRPLFGLAPPAVARIHVRAGCHRVPTDARAYTAVVDTTTYARHEPSQKRRIAAKALSRGQRTLLRAGPHRDSRLAPPSRQDTALAAAAEGRAWTVSGADAWDWFAGSGVLRVLDLGESRALVRLDESQPSTVQIVAWNPQRRSLAAARGLLRAAAALARERAAPTLRFQPWRGDDDERALARACMLSGFVRRWEADLLLYPDGADVDDVRLTPFFYVTF
jgi:GNAT superfamily N-acetyltransferase